MDLGLKSTTDERKRGRGLEEGKISSNMEQIFIYPSEAEHDIAIMISYFHVFPPDFLQCPHNQELSQVEILVFSTK